MNGLTFALPEWFWGWLVLLPLLVLRIWSHFRASRQLPGLVSPRLSRRLINGANQARRWVVFTLQGLAILCLCAALARPQLGFDEVESEIDARNLLIAIDTSRSMMSDDLPPNRLARAKLAAKDIVLSLPEDRVGLLAFAGKPFLQAPLTIDHEAILEAIDQLDTEVIPRGGTNLSAAVTLALTTVAEAKLGRSALVIFSDGEALEGLAEIEKVRDKAAEEGLSILAVGVGTSEGSIIPEVDENGDAVAGAFVKDEKGQVVRTRLTPESLQALASRGGAYIHLGGAASLSRVVDQIRQGIASSREEGETRLRPIERFLWPLSGAAILLVLSHLVPLFWLKPTTVRRGSLPRKRAITAAVALLALMPLHAMSGDPFLSGHDAFASENYTDALAAYESSLGEKLSTRARSRVQMGIGAAAYRLSNFERAAEAFGQAIAGGDTALRGEALYNLGNTLFRRGEVALLPKGPQKPDPDQVQELSTPADALAGVIREWEGAIEHYQSSLSLDPDNEQTTHNLEYVKRRLDELKKQQEEQQKEEDKQKQDEEKKDEEKKEEEKKEDEKKDEKDNKEKDPSNPEEKDDKQEKSDDKKEPGDSPPQDPKDESGKDEPKQEPGDRKEPGDPKNQPDKPKEGDSESQDQGDKPGQQPPPQPGEAPPQDSAPPRDGPLEANPNQAQPGSQSPPQTAPPVEMQPNPLTGYSPTEARQLLDSLADETEVRPLLQPSKGEKFKNW